MNLVGKEWFPFTKDDVKKSEDQFLSRVKGVCGEAEAKEYLRAVKRNVDKAVSALLGQSPAG
jgi:hypothetical protein